ncbi:MAG: DUF5989 family protein [Patescibacteria group bacterium]
MENIKDFLTFLKEQKKWWLFPIVLVLLLVSTLLVFVSGSAISPFIYTMF